MVLRSNSTWFKYNMTDIAAALGIHQLKKVPQFLNRRQKLQKYIKNFEKSIILPSNDTDLGHTHGIYL